MVVDEDTWLDEVENERCNESDSVLSFLSSPPFDRLPALEELLEMLVSTVHNSAICKKKKVKKKIVRDLGECCLEFREMELYDARAVFAEGIVVTDGGYAFE